MSFGKSKTVRVVIAVVLILGLINFLKNRIFQSETIQPLSDSAQTPVVSQNLNIKDWKTYKSDLGGYQLSYPQQWSEKVSEGRFIISSKSDSAQEGEAVSFSVSVDKSYSAVKNNVNQFDKLYNQPNGASDSGKVKLQNLSISGYSAVMVQQQTKSGSTSLQELIYQIKYDDLTLYNLSFSPFTSKTWTSNSAIITNIVQSFKFLPTLTPSPVQAQ